MLFANFAQHPADGLVDEIVLVVEKGFGETDGIVEVGGLDEAEGGEHGDAPVPDALALGQLVQEAAVLVDEVAADDFGRGDVHQVPTVDPSAVRYVAVVDEFLFFVAFRLLRPIGEDHGRQQAYFVKGRL